MDVYFTIKLLILLCATLFNFSACSQQSRQRAGQGAATGAAVGAVGGMLSALVFGGNVGEAAARGAVYGGSTGAAAGAISGAVADSNQKKAQEAAELEALRKRLGDDEAESALQNALAIEPDHLDYLYALAVLYMHHDSRNLL